VARRKSLPDTTRIVPVNLLERQYKMLRTVASRRGVSVSELVREAVEMYLRDQSVKLGIELVFEDPKADSSREVRVEEDPVILFRREQLKVEAMRVIRGIDSLERTWQMLAPKITGAYGHRVLSSEFYNLRDEVERTQRKLYGVLKGYSRELHCPELDQLFRDAVERLSKLRTEIGKVVSS